MYETEPEDDLQNLEKELCKVSELFYHSLDDLRFYSPFINLENEENYQNSKQNQERIAFEQIQNYQDKVNENNQMIDDYASKMNKLFDNISGIINTMKTREEFKVDDEELNKNLKKLKEANTTKAQIVSEKVKYINDLVCRIKIEKDIDMNIKEKGNEDHLSFDLESI